MKYHQTLLDDELMRQLLRRCAFPRNSYQLSFRPGEQIQSAFGTGDVIKTLLGTGDLVNASIRTGES